MSQHTSAAVRVYRSLSRDPYCNLAIEDWLYRSLPLFADGGGERRLFLYRNDPCVVVGRHQNPWLECDLQGMQQQAVPLVRRQSGGGTVYHDGGNINWCFIASREQYSQDENFAVVIAALAGLGVSAERSGRNDLLVDGRKISGSAFKVARERCFHHGTLLLDADLGRLTAFLTPRKRSMQSKGIDSVRSRVANLSEFGDGIGYMEVCRALAQAFVRRYSPDSVEQASEMQVCEGCDDCDDETREYEQGIQAWDWLYGKTPDFTHAVDFAVDFRGEQIPLRAILDLHRGRVRDLTLETAEGRGLQPLLQAAQSVAREQLQDCPYRGAQLEQGLVRSAATGNPDRDGLLRALAEAVRTEVE